MQTVPRSLYCVNQLFTLALLGAYMLRRARLPLLPAAALAVCGFQPSGADPSPVDAQMSLFKPGTTAPTPEEDAARERILLGACGGPGAVVAHDLGPVACERIAAEIEGAS